MIATDGGQRLGRLTRDRARHLPQQGRATRVFRLQVRQVAAAVGVPEQIIRKAPSADLWPGQTDEVEAGFTYPELDRLLYWMIDKRRSRDELLAKGFAGTMIDRVDRMVASSEFKRQVPPVAKLGPRTTGIDYLYPRRRPGSARIAPQK